MAKPFKLTTKDIHVDFNQYPVLKDRFYLHGYYGRFDEKWDFYPDHSEELQEAYEQGRLDGLSDFE